jgi:hypothetical protein
MMVSAVSHQYLLAWQRRHWPALGLLAILAVPLIFLAGKPALSQGYGGRTAAVETAPAKQEILSRYTDVQGRMVAGNSSAITAVTNGVVDLATLRIGDMVEQGQLRNCPQPCGPERRYNVTGFPALPGLSPPPPSVPHSPAREQAFQPEKSTAQPEWQAIQELANDAAATPAGIDGKQQKPSSDKTFFLNPRDPAPTAGDEAKPTLCL